jgi:integrase
LLLSTGLAIVRIVANGNSEHFSEHLGCQCSDEGGAMSYSNAKGGWEVRWRDSTGRQRSRRFKTEETAKEFDESIHDHELSERRRETRHGQSGGIYPYETASGTRWRYVARRSDGSQTSKRGFPSEKAARDARRRLVEKHERGELRHSKHTFGSWWQQWLPQRKAHIEPGSWANYEIHGRKRLLPVLQSIPLERVDEAAIQELVDVMAEEIEAEELAPKTANNALATLVVCLNGAVKAREISRNAALEIDRFRDDEVERDYLRLHEIPVYLESCSDVYRPVAELLLSSGLRVSEALGLQLQDLELSESAGAIVVYRSRKRSATRQTTSGSTKSDKFRRVEIGPKCSRALSDQLARRAEMAAGEQPKAPLFVMPVRTRKRAQGRWEGHGAGKPMDRNTISRDWHKATLQDAALRDMPLHALRHTAAASWLAAGNSLMYVQHQLGHSNINTTERYYGHLERHVLAAGAAVTEEAIANADKRAA